jgi:hypothetical protein
MGGPSRASYLAAQKRKAARLAAMRTRDGVVDLAEWRAALPSVAAIQRLLGPSPWLVEARLAPAADVGFVLRVTLLWDAEEARLCLPTTVNDVPVQVVVRNARTQGAAEVSRGAPTSRPGGDGSSR